MNPHKIIFAGPVGAGKTTSIASISDIEPFATEELITDEARDIKEQTTVAMDFGLLELPNGECIHLYGVPGQARFDFMWDILIEGGIGLILLLDNQSRDPLADMNYYLDSFKDFIDRTGLAVGITKMQHGQCPSIDDYAVALERRGLRVPVLEVDGRRPEDVTVLVQSLLYALDPGVARHEAERI